MLRIGGESREERKSHKPHNNTCEAIRFALCSARKLKGRGQVVKAAAFDAAIRRFESSRPCHYKNSLKSRIWGCFFVFYSTQGRSFLRFC